MGFARRRAFRVLLAAAVAAAVSLFALTALPDRRTDLPQPPWQSPLTVAGAFHVHSNRSDGSGTDDEIAAAAARAGLKFVVLTDHGDGTRPPDPPQYRSGVLCINAVEISTSNGHYIAIGLSQTPYPLGGEARDVVEDVRRLGGFGVVAHPDSAKPSLQWHEWTAPFDGIEWLNADSEWRDESAGRLARALLEYPLRPVEVLGTLLDRQERTFARWDALTQRRRIVGLAGADAHARVGWRDDDTNGYRHGWFMRMPSYEVSFRTFALRVDLDHPLSGDPNMDQDRVVAAIRSGRLYTGVDAIASPAALNFSARRGAESAGEGGLLPPDGPVSFVARVNAPSGGFIVLRKNGAILTQHPLPELSFEAEAGPGVYRVEVYLANSPGLPPVPWIVSNPIYVQPADWGVPVPVKLLTAVDRWPIQSGPWHIEKDAGSEGEASAPAPQGTGEFSYRLAGGAKTGQYTAFVLSTGNALTGHARFAFTAHASRPMRISVQARRPTPGERWQRSVYLDEQPREILIPFTQMTPAGATSTFGFDPAQIDTVLFVVDTTNSLPGSAGTFVVSELRVEH